MPDFLERFQGTRLLVGHNVQCRSLHSAANIFAAIVPAGLPSHTIPSRNSKKKMPWLLNLGLASLS
jgi:hypothetical protein